MTTIAIAAPATTTAATILTDLAAGAAKVYRVRENGTFRRVHFLAEGTVGREHAEWVAAQREEEGRSMKDIAAEINMSIASVRRMLNDLAMTEELEESEEEELEALLLGAEDAATAEATAE